MLKSKRNSQAHTSFIIIIILIIILTATCQGLQNKNKKIGIWDQCPTRLGTMVLKPTH